MKTIIRVVYKNGKSEALTEFTDTNDSDGYDFMALLVDNGSAFDGNPSQGKAFFNYFLIEIYIEDVFRKERKKSLYFGNLAL